MISDTTLLYSSFLGKEAPMDKSNIKFGGCFTFTAARRFPLVLSGRCGNLNLPLPDIKVYIKDLNNWIKSNTTISDDVVIYRGNICKRYSPKKTKVDNILHSSTGTMINAIASNANLKSKILKEKFYFRKLSRDRKSDFNSITSYVRWRDNNFCLVNCSTNEWYDSKIDPDEAWKISPTSEISLNKPIKFYSVDAKKQGKKKEILLQSWTIFGVASSISNTSYRRSLGELVRGLMCDYSNKDVVYIEEFEKVTSNMIEIRFDKTSTVCQPLSFLVTQFIRPLIAGHSQYKEIPVKYIHLKKLFPNKDFMELMGLVNISTVLSYDPYKWPGRDAKYLFPSSRILKKRLEDLHKRELRLNSDNGASGVYNARGSRTNDIFKGNRIDTDAMLGVNDRKKRGKELHTIRKRLHKLYRENITLVKDLDVRNIELTSEIATEWENLAEIASSLDTWLKLKATKCKDTLFLHNKSIYDGIFSPENKDYYKVVADDLIMRNYKKKRFVVIEK